MSAASKFNYDVAFSFAGEDREYVAKVAEVLHQLGVKIFYDDYERANLWGKDLYSHLDEVYRKKSKYCVIFISKHYKRKLWTNHERISAQAKAFKSRKEYILPAKFDDTEILGIRPTQGYIDLRQILPDDLARIIARKIGKWDEIEELLNYLKKELFDYEITVDGTDLKFKCDSEDYDGNFPIRLMLEMYRCGQIYNMFFVPGIVPY